MSKVKKDMSTAEMCTSTVKKEDMRETYVLSLTAICLFLIMGSCLAAQTYINAVYELEVAKVHYLRNPYIS